MNRRKEFSSFARGWRATATVNPFAESYSRAWFTSNRWQPRDASAAFLSREEEKSNVHSHCYARAFCKPIKNDGRREQGHARSLLCTLRHKPLREVGWICQISPTSLEAGDGSRSGDLTLRPRPWTLRAFYTVSLSSRDYGGWKEEEEE